jgi:hypothetical protein
VPGAFPTFSHFQLLVRGSKATIATSRNHHSQIMKNERERSIDPSINPHDSTITTA